MQKLELKQKDSSTKTNMFASMVMIIKFEIIILIELILVKSGLKVNWFMFEYTFCLGE